MAGTKMYRAKTGSSARSISKNRARNNQIVVSGALSYWEKVIKITKQNSVCAGVYGNVGGLSKSSSLQFCAMQNIIAFL